MMNNHEKLHTRDNAEALQRLKAIADQVNSPYRFNQIHTLLKLVANLPAVFKEVDAYLHLTEVDFAPVHNGKAGKAAAPATTRCC